MASRGLTEINTEIHRYRITGDDVGTMFGNVGQLTDGVLIALAHAQAELDAEQHPAPSAADALASEDFEGIQDLWQATRTHLTAAFAPSSAPAFVEREQASAEAVGTAIVSFWGAFGLTFSDLPNGGLYIHVAPPRAAA